MRVRKDRVSIIAPKYIVKVVEQPGPPVRLRGVGGPSEAKQREGPYAVDMDDVEGRG